MITLAAVKRIIIDNFVLLWALICSILLGAQNDLNRYCNKNNSGKVLLFVS